MFSFTSVTTVHASKPESSNNPDEQIIRIVSYGSIIGETIINHHLYLGIDKNAVDIFEPLFDAFGDRLYGLKTAFGKVTVRYEGAFDDIDTGDFTDINLKWNGDPLEFSFSLARKATNGSDYGFVTDIYLDITSKYTKPGMYSFSGKYKGVPFILYIKVIPERDANIPADPAALTHLSVTYLPVDEAESRPVSDISFHFAGAQQWFTAYDLRDARLTCGGVEVPVNIHDYIVRHFVYDEDGNIAETVFTLVFINPLTSPGIYRLSGYYRDEPFNLSWIQLN